MNLKGLVKQVSGSRGRGRGRSTGTTPTPATGRRGGSAGTGSEEVVRGVKKLLRNRKR